MQKIVTNLWFDGRVEEALDFYFSIFKNSKLNSVSRYGDAGPGPKGEILVANFELEGQEFTIINGGPGFPHSPAMSLLVNCQDQAEIDYLWERLSDGGETSQCGWLIDPFGVQWQIVPADLERLMQSENSDATERVMEALLKMTKLDIAELEKAYNDE
ncbi:MAG: VOC family protein [Caldilineales bacterium]|nr:VOC family protein [Caldilineales bacterium]